MSERVKERPIVFDQQMPLVGIVTEARPDVTPGGSDGRTACILLNAGLIHRVGPHRLYVRIARHLASIGYPTLRFDLSNRGDSDARHDGMSFLESSLVETRSAMDALQKTVGADRFVLIGICSGAVNALQVATHDPRVVGAVAIDAPAYPTWQYHLRYYARRLRNPQTWRNTFAGRNKVGRWLLRRGTAVVRQRQEEDEFGNVYGDIAMPSRSESESRLRQIVDRGAKMIFIYSGVPAYNYRNQFRDAFPRVMKQGAIRVEYMSDADHTFTRLRNQEHLLSVISRWVTDMFGACTSQGRSDQQKAVGAR
jgi:pimeloyl-ACP methyl ester carboxylesterase